MASAGGWQEAGIRFAEENGVPREFSELEVYLHQNASGLADSLLHCPRCGRSHQVPIEKVQIGEGLIEALPDMAAEILGGKPHKTALVYDRAIEDIIQETVIHELSSMDLELVGLGEKNTWLESETELGDEVARQLGARVDLVLGAGSGVIADLAKWIADKVGKPLILYGTAPSMNAHTSVTSTMTRDGIKTTAWLAPAKAVLFDVPVLAASPKRMRLAGMGDLAARTICNADWHLGRLLRQRYFCPVPFQLTGLSEPLYLNAGSSIGLGEMQAVRGLGEAVLISGLSMTMVGGDTSPSSGCEHVFSHYWDLQVELEGAPKNLHGTQVGVGTLLAHTLWDFMRRLDISRLDPLRLLRCRPSLEALKDENRVKFGSKARLFDEALQQKWMPDEQFVPYLRSILDSWETFWDGLTPYFGRRESVQSALESAGFVFSLEAIQRTRQQALDALVYGGRYRSRYTMLDLAWELGVLPNAADEILDRSGLV